MSTVQPIRSTHPRSAPAISTVLARTCRAEWSRLWTVRTTWWFVLATATAVLGLGVLLGIDVQGEPQSMPPGTTAWRGGQLTATFGLYGLLALCVVAVTADHSTGGIVPTLQATPRRGILLAARATVIVTFATVLGCSLVAAASAIVHAFAPDLGLPLGVGLDVLGDVAFVYAVCMLIAVGAGFLARNPAGTLVAVLGATLVLPVMVGALPFDWSRTVAELLPGTGALVLLAGEAPVAMTRAAARATLLVWAVLVTMGGGVRLLRSDVHH